ncbi:hypothetical protein K458DRAFT_128705 [Lentithecium fluviatile CBS 122367]|uniref:Uncharacterized protein n=1 Tax=Lentithecium fluviatile CBS 122367 TaxID=1168545 RepID=A0A6G1JGD8_9PLEO|nr:hypothetical protein K458DRAFT_128705 [Lentithecium fluviatile CBS 122367]
MAAVLRGVRGAWERVVCGCADVQAVVGGGSWSLGWVRSRASLEHRMGDRRRCSCDYVSRVRPGDRSHAGPRYLGDRQKDGFNNRVSAGSFHIKRALCCRCARRHPPQRPEASSQTTSSRREIPAIRLGWLPIPQSRGPFRPSVTHLERRCAGRVPDLHDTSTP